MKTPGRFTTSGDFQCLQLALIEGKGTRRIEFRNLFYRLLATESTFKESGFFFSFSLIRSFSWDFEPGNVVRVEMS